MGIGWESMLGSRILTVVAVGRPKVFLRFVHVSLGRSLSRFGRRASDIAIWPNLVGMRSSLAL